MDPDQHRDPHTVALHADGGIDEAADVAPPIRPSTTFVRSEDGYTYRRDAAPTTQRLEAVLGALGGGSAVVFPSGMAATAALFRMLRPSRVSVPQEAYHGTLDFVASEAARGAWDVVAPAELKEGDLWWLETPSNPRGLIADLADVAARASRAGVVTAVDSTFATPVLQRPLDHGIAFAMHSTTKFISGHSDAMGGVIVAGDADSAQRLRAGRTLDGSVPGSLETWLTLRGVRSLPLRIQRQSASALTIAERLDAHRAEGRVALVWYPGLPSHAGHAVARTQMTGGYGGVLSFEMADAPEAAALVAALRLFTVATSLGGVESLAEHRVTSDPHAPPGLVRLSIGLESPEDLIADLDQAIATVTTV